MSAPLAELTSWRADWRGLKVVVLGLSVTGFSVADTLAELGAEVLVATERADPEYARLVPVIGARLWTGPLDPVPDAVREHAPQVVVASPGFPPHHPVIAWARESGVAVWGDIELAWRVRDKVVRADGRPADWVLITGTNGKTTTTRLAATMLVAGGLRAVPCGNIGTPILDAVRDPAGFDVLVVELSSHQLWYLGLQQDGPDPVSPHASVCLNLADDHLEWHGSFLAYRDAKAVVYAHTRVACVYNKADAATRRMVEEADVVEGCRAIGFDLGVPGPSDLGVVDGILVDRAFLEERRTSALELTTLDELAARGLAAPHIVANALAASAFAGRRAGGDPRGAGRLPARPAPHRGRRRRGRRHVGGRLEGHEPARRRVVARRLPGRRMGRRGPPEGRRHRRARRRARPHRQGRDRDRGGPGRGRGGVRPTRARGAAVRGRCRSD